MRNLCWQKCSLRHGSKVLPNQPGPPNFSLAAGGGTSRSKLSNVENDQQTEPPVSKRAVLFVLFRCCYRLLLITLEIGNGQVAAMLEPSGSGSLAEFGMALIGYGWLFPLPFAGGP